MSPMPENPKPPAFPTPESRAELLLRQRARVSVRQLAVEVGASKSTVASSIALAPQPLAPPNLGPHPRDPTLSTPDLDLDAGSLPGSWDILSGFRSTMRASVLPLAPADRCTTADPTTPERASEPSEVPSEVPWTTTWTAVAKSTGHHPGESPRRDLHTLTVRECHPSDERGKESRASPASRRHVRSSIPHGCREEELFVRRQGATSCRHHDPPNRCTAGLW